LKELQWKILPGIHFASFEKIQTKSGFARYIA